MIKIKTMPPVSLFIKTLLLVLLTSSYAYADTSVNVDRVRWKKGLFNWTDHDQYPQWKQEGIWTENRKKTYVSKYITPSKGNTKTMVMLIAGQQGSSGSSGGSNCLTGQNQSWDSGWGKGDKTKSTNIKSLSLSDRLINSGHINPYETFFSIVLNSNFNWEATSNAKDKAEEAFTDWLLTHGESQNVERIILLGSSRGGALAMRMSKNIKQRSGWNNVPVYVGLLDAVPNEGQDELKTQGQPSCTNPLNGGYYSRKANLNSFFGSLNKPDIFHIITGAPVIGFIDAVHSFCADESSWYQQTWANLEHKEIGRCNTSEGGAYETAKMNAGIVPLYNWVIEKLYE
jgi:hypothetical protein